METKYFNISDSETKSLQDERAIIHYITTNDIDRTKDVMNPAGMDATDFLKARTVFFNHNYNQPIAKNTELITEPNGVKAKTVFSETKFADDVYKWHLEGIVKTWSIGFRANRKDVTIDEETNIWTYNKWNLLEYSSAPLPANPNALDQAKAVTKSIEGISMIDNSMKFYEFSSIIESQTKELNEIKDLIKNINKSENNSLNEEIKREFQKEIEEIKNIITGSNKNFEGIQSDYSKLLEKIKSLEQRNVSDIELARIITGEVMRGVNSQISKAFLMVTGKEVKLN